MINLTLDVIFKKEGHELQKAIKHAIKDTRKILFDRYSDGRAIPNEQIVSTSKKKPNTHPLAFCKYFDEAKLKYLPVACERFISESHRLYTKRKVPKKNELSEIIPQFDAVKHQLSGTFITQIMRGIGVMLMSLWSQDAIILTSNFKMPGANEGQRGKKSILTEQLDTEVLSFFQHYREEEKEGNPQEICPSARKNIKNYAWRMIIATDWHKVENICVVETAQYQKAAADHKAGRKSFVNVGPPMNDMLLLVKNTFGDRAKYTLDDFIVAREEEFSTKIKGTSYSPYDLQKGPWHSDIAGFDLRKACTEWIDTQIIYVETNKQRGMKTYLDIAKSLKLLNEYLFYELPRKQHKVPIAPKDFTRDYLNINSDLPSLIDYIQEGRTTDTAYGHLIKIDGYFVFLEKSSTARASLKGFKNPFSRRLDFPKLTRQKGTNKNIVTQKHFPAMLSYFYAIEQFIWHLIDVLINQDNNCETRKTIASVINELPPAYDTWLNTEACGFVPFVYHKGKTYPIKKIHKSVLSLANRKLKERGSVKLPNIIHLHQTLVAFETGIRNIHIKWLDADGYEKHINRTQPLPPICKLEVTTDKVKSTSWTAHVSRRVIHLLDKLKDLRNKYDEPWVGESYWYGKHKNSPFGKLKPLFPTGGNTKTAGKPANDSTAIKKFKQLLIAFQEFANGSTLFDEPIKWAFVEEYKDTEGNLARKYESEITPHSARATVVSHNIKFLPPHIIGKYQTGHESEEMVSYYHVLDPEYQDNLEEGQSQAVRGYHPLLNGADDPISIKAEATHSALRQAVDIKLDESFTDFGAISFERETPTGVVESGIAIASKIGAEQLGHNSTHICPYNNNCPADVKIEIGEKNCGQCWASIKTVDHLPRITAHVRDLHAKIDELSDTIDLMVQNEASEVVIDQHEQERHALACEESAWIASCVILEEFRKEASMRDSFLVTKPEIIEKHLSSIATDNSPLTNILTRIQDAKNYPEYLTPQLQTSVIRLRNKILSQTGDIDKLVNQPTGYELIDEFRGIIRGVCEAADRTVEDLSKAMSIELPAGNNALLESL